MPTISLIISSQLASAQHYLWCYEAAECGVLTNRYSGRQVSFVCHAFVYMSFKETFT